MATGRPDSPEGMQAAASERKVTLTLTEDEATTVAEVLSLVQGNAKTNAKVRNAAEVLTRLQEHGAQFNPSKAKGKGKVTFE